MNIIISGTGLFTPPHAISNEALVNCFNEYVDQYNHKHYREIEQGTRDPLQKSDCDFIEKASGIKNRFAMEIEGVLDPNRMCAYIPPRSDDVPSLQCEMALNAISEALEVAQKKPPEVDAILVACSNMQRAYPGIAVEIQSHLGSQGYGFDMNIACSSATFGIQMARGMIESNSANCVIVVTPELSAGQLNYRDRDSHFIFGDVCTAIVLEREETCKASSHFKIISTDLKTKYSNNIRCNDGFTNRCELKNIYDKPIQRFFTQNGRKVFKEMVPMAFEHIIRHLKTNGFDVNDIKRFWLHQANKNMNDLIAKKLFDGAWDPNRAPLILENYGNTGAAGSIACFHKYHKDFQKGDKGIICSFGAGYSIGSVILEKGMTKPRKC